MSHRISGNPVVRTDRVVFTSSADLKAAVGRLSYRTVSDYALRNMDVPYGAYGRALNLVNDSTKTRVVVSYRPRFRGLSLMRIATIPEDRPGLRRRELARVLRAFAPYQLVIVEMAIDFSRGAMNAEFVRRHLKYRKCRMRRNWQYPKSAWLGAPASATFVRCYPKKEVGGFRVEAQFNRAFLKKHRIKTPRDFLRLPGFLAKDVGFFEVNWPDLRRYAHRHLRHPGEMIRMARERRKNLVEMLKFLRSVIPNANRFLVPLPINKNIRKALDRFQRKWR